ncbi:MAG: nicotinate-nucleotide adenylyltransferase [Clostridium sp.]|uniref:nicotinate-nucleotide adenylyltransferase n=1 Tax=Clostridium sp. TaxID=1506 RepID=UPI002A858B2A|nr:nicotinate-nucleotide adenylyltransferase [Clostridium sp.]MDY5097358.1 nicotinate-nucleotide adenylyltransferase [Clostridium sp.]
MRKIGILGGTFNPIHNGHIHIGKEALKALALDEVIFVPTGRPRHKLNDASLLNENLRYRMVGLAIQGHEGFSISDYEINKKGFSFTYETLKYFSEIYKDSHLYFISGADCLINIYKWKNVADIFKRATLVVFNRPGFSKEDILAQKKKVEEDFNTEIIFLDVEPLEISSTDIRKAVKNQDEITDIIPKPVMNFIKEHNLYKSQE